MNHSSLGLKLTKALSGFLQYKTAASLSPNTLKTYDHYIKLWLNHTDDKDLSEYTTTDLRELLAWLRTEYKPGRFNHSTAPIAQEPAQHLGSALLVLDLGEYGIRFSQSHEGNPRTAF